MPSNLTLVSSPTFTTTGVTAGFGSALVLNGSSQYAAVNGTAFVFAAGATFTVRGRFKTSASATMMLISCCRDPNVNWAVTVSSAGKPGIYVRGFNGNATMEATSLTVNDGNWHDFEMVVNEAAGTAKLFIDGVLPAGASGSGGSYDPDTDGSQFNYIGAFNSGTGLQFYWNGQIDEISIYNTALHTSDFTAPTTPASNTAANLVALWHLDSGNSSSSTVLDCAGATFSVDPSSGGTGTSIAFTGTATQWTTVAPAFTITGSSNTIINQSVTTATAATGDLSPTTSGSQTITDLSTGATVSFTVNPPTPSLTITGPTSGITSQASTNFTITSSAAAVGDVSVTLSDGGAGGTFTPSSPTITNGQTTVTFTYTPSSIGVKTLQATATSYNDSNEFDYLSYSTSRFRFSTSVDYGDANDGLAASIGFTIYSAVDGTVLLPHTTGQTYELADEPGVYVAAPYVEPTWAGVLVWDRPSGSPRVSQAFGAS